MVYHETESGGFTEFIDTDDIGYFFTSSFNMARSYSGEREVYAPSRISTWDEALKEADDLDGFAKLKYTIWASILPKSGPVETYFKGQTVKMKIADAVLSVRRADGVERTSTNEASAKETVRLSDIVSTPQVIPQGGVATQEGAHVLCGFSSPS